MLELIALIARLELPVDRWPEYWPAMFEMANSGDAAQRESVLGIVEELGDKIFDGLRPLMDDFIHMCAVSMGADQNPHVRVAAMMAAGTLMGEVYQESDPLVAKFRPLVLMMLDVIQFCLASGAEHEANEGLTTFQALIETCPTIIAPSVGQISQFCILTSSNPNVEWDVRQECLTFLEWVIQFRPSFITKQGLLDPIITICFDIAAEPQMEGLGSWEVTPHRFALQIIDCLCRFIKPKHTFDNLIARIDAWMTSPNPWQRRAAIGVLSAMPNGCCELMITAIPNLLPYLQASFDDQDSYVRQAGCILLGQLADFLCPDILEHHEVCLPLAYRAMCDDDPEIQERALYSLVTFMENLKSLDADQLLDQIMRRLVNILEISPSKDVQELAIHAISAVASVTLDKFIPYWSVVTKMMEQLMDITQPELLSLRARALDCVGVIAMSVGKDVFAPFFPYFMNKALEGYNMPGTEQTEMRELAINFFGNAAEALGADFTPYFDTCLNIIFEVLLNQDGVKPELSADQLHMAQLMIDSDEEDEGARINRHLPATGADDVDDADDLPEELAGLKYITNQGQVSEKTVALQALGTFSHAMGALFVPHIPRCMEVLQTTFRYIHPKVRSFTIFPIEAMTTTLHLANPPARVWEPGAGNPEDFPLPQVTQSFVDDVIGLFIAKTMADFDLAVVARLIDAFMNILNTLGAPAIHHHMVSLGTCILKVLHMETAAHAMETEECDGENEEVAQELLAVFDSACDFVVALAKHYGRSFPQFFSLLEGIIKHLTAEAEPSADDGSERWRQDAVGALAEVVDASGVDSFSVGQVHILLVQAIRALSDPHLSTRCNGIYLTRLVACHPASLDWWNIILNNVVPLMAYEDDQTQDNAVGCIAAMITANISHIPMAEVIPEVLNALPMRCDQTEATIVYNMLLSLLQNGNQDIFPHIPTAFKVLVETLGTPVIADNTREQISEAVRHLWAQYSNELQPVLETFDEDTSTNLQTILQQQHQ